MTRPRLRLIGFAFVALLAATFAFLVLRSSSHVQYVSWIPRRVGVWADSNGIVRTGVGSFALGLATFLLVGRTVWHALIVCVFATTVEVAQLWIPERSFDWKDILVGIAGVIVAWCLARAVRRRPT